jgi:Acyl-CoA carboxylase epsilon subunit
MSQEEQGAKPSFSVLSGNPTPEELAVVVAVLQAASASAAASAGSVAEPVSNWHRNAGLLRAPITPGYGQWRAAYRRGLTR